ncbi:tetratricopeptide repeat protein [Terasakiella sp. A23]|uniref:tetratricopeptide repeat protein n=1 Tax=Terasakiella sp. FCG-A23 TaxID=3080561 RepID=UPI002952F0A4|nr:tetratricopeptide repeat protein [Terasakiella sp. A23]MDV7339039.1 tetratricopeptide repeat protein [Terasakiella sp. A23]
MTEIEDLYNQAIELEQAGENEKAIALFTQLAELSPKDVMSRHRLAILHFNQSDFKTAQKIAQNALKLAPKHVELNFLISEAMWRSNQKKLSIRHLNYTLQLLPDSTRIHSSLAQKYYETAQLELALKHFSIIRELEPKNCVNLKDLARTLFYMQKLEKAAEAYKELLALTPDDAENHFLFGTLLLSLGETTEAWEHYSWRHRYQAPQFTSFKDNYTQWVGQPLQGKSILVTWEQGLGDTVHFVRYVFHLCAMGAHVILDTRPILIELFERLIPENKSITIHNADQEKPDADFLISIMDIPYVLRSLNLPDLDYEFPYLKAPDDLVLKFQERLSSHNGFKIGISWQGNPDYPRDATRSIPLSAFEPIAKLEGIDLISVQAIFGTDQIKNVPFPIEDLETDLLGEDRGLAPLAAAISQMDLMITCDSATAHIAGAMNVPTWLMLPTIPDWRWGWGKTTTVLYPSLTLIRCPSDQSWNEVLVNTSTQLKHHIQRQNTRHFFPIDS